MIRSRRFYHYLFSYILLMMVLLLIMSAVIYRNFLSTLRAEVEQSTIVSLAQFRDAVDLRMRELNRTAMQISGNPLLTPFMVTEDGYGPYMAVAELKKYLSTNLFIYDIVIRFNAREPEQMYAASGTYSLDLFFGDIYRFWNWSKEEFVRTSDALSSPVMRPLEPVRFNRLTDERFVSYLAPLPDASDAPYGVVLFLVSEGAFRNLAAGVLGEYHGLLYVLDEQHGVLYRYVKGESEETGDRVLDAIGRMDREWTIETLQVGNRHFTAVRLPSRDPGRSYVTAMPTDQIMRKVDETRLLFNTTVTIVFALGLVLAVGLSIRSYKPLQRLAGIVSSQHKPSGDGARPRNEIDLISSAVTRMARENEGLIHRLRSQAGALREQVLLSLIKGKLKTPEEWEDMLAFSDLRLDRPYFAVMLFLIDDYGRFRRDNSASMQDLLKYSLIKVLEELSEEAGHGYGVELIDGRSIVFLVNLNEGFDDDSVLRGLAEKAKEVFRQYFKFTVTTGIGGIRSDITAIPQSFVEASHAARHRFVKGGNQVILFHEIEPVKAGERWYPVEHVERLVKAIKQGDGAAVGDTVQEAFLRIAEKNVPVEAAECICFDIVNNIVKTLIELDIDIDEELGDAMERLFVPRFETTQELERLAADICQSVCRRIANQKESKNIALLNRMKAYIEAHYTDRSISLEMIAEQFGLSPSYATRFFKDHTGYPLMRYVDDLRMREAKRLLKTTGLNLKEIMNEVGYVDSTNFIRKFKKLEGVTPIQYRNLTNTGT